MMQNEFVRTLQPLGPDVATPKKNLWEGIAEGIGGLFQGGKTPRKEQIGQPVFEIGRASCRERVCQYV